MRLDWGPVDTGSLPFVSEVNAARAQPHRTFLFVSAPFGPFGRELAGALRELGAGAFRVILNGGDALDWGRDAALAYGGSCAGWPRWLERKIVEREVTDVLVYGDSSPYAASALHVAAALGVRAWVLEQGYFRPDWVTIERNGVNANSRLPRDPAWYRTQAAVTTPAGEARKVGRTTPAAVAHIVAYHLAAYACAPLYPRYRAHYSDPAHRQAVGHLARFGRQQLSRWKHRRAFEALVASGAPLFLCVLQRPGDSQLVRHSDFISCSAFIDRVVASFAKHAPPDGQLVIRPHPLDPGLTPHATLAERAARREGVTGRVSYIDHGKLHEVLPRFDGVVCVNSTAGLAAIEMGRPTITLGRAFYDMPGMTHQGDLEGFWTSRQAPDPALYDAFRRAVLAETQVNGAYATAGGRRLAVAGVAARLMSPADPEPRLSAPSAATRAPTRSAHPMPVLDVAAAVAD